MIFNFISLIQVVSLAIARQINRFRKRQSYYIEYLARFQIKQANREMVSVPIVDGTIPHKVIGTYGAAKVVLLPASPGTGIIAGPAVRAVCEAAGIKDILTKSFRSNNPSVLVKATFSALQQLRTREDVELLRGVKLS